MDKKLKKIREKTGLTQVQVAANVGISEISYQRIEYGSQRPSLRTAIRIAKVLNSTVEDLFPISSTVVGDMQKQPDCNRA